MTAALDPALRFPLRAFLGVDDAAASHCQSERWGAGHIHDSWRVSDLATSSRYFLQRVNSVVFPDGDALAHNLPLIIDRLAGEWQRRGAADWRRRTLALHAVPVSREAAVGGTLLRDGTVLASHLRDDDGGIWRCFDFLDDAHAVQVADRPEQAFEAARAFGQFQSLLSTMPVGDVREVIPAFHDTPARIDALEAAAVRDAAGRAAGVSAELAVVRARRRLTSTLAIQRARGELPVRLVHNDAKIANVLFDDATGATRCVVDLDTVMPGLVAWDFGDLVRSMASAAAEDAPDPAQVTVRWEFLDAIVRGYLTDAAAFLAPVERASLVTGALTITLEQGARFLTDYLEADRYYKVTHAGQNLARARTQFALLTQLEAVATRLEHAVASFAP